MMVEVVAHLHTGIRGGARNQGTPTTQPYISICIEIIFYIRKGGFRLIRMLGVDNQRSFHPSKAAALIPGCGKGLTGRLTGPKLGGGCSLGRALGRRAFLSSTCPTWPGRVFPREGKRDCKAPTRGSEENSQPLSLAPGKAYQRSFAEVNRPPPPLRCSKSRAEASPRFNSCAISILGGASWGLETQFGLWKGGLCWGVGLC